MEGAPAALTDIDLSSLPEGVPPMPSDVPIPATLSEQSAGCCSRWRYWVSLTLCLAVCYKSMRNNAVKCFTCNQCCINAKGDVSGSMHEKKPKGKKKTTESVSAESETDNDDRIAGMSESNKRQKAYDKHTDSNGEEDSDSDKEEHQKASVKKDEPQKRMTEDEKDGSDKVKKSKGKLKSREEKKPKGKKKTTESISAESETDNDDRKSGMSESNKRQKVYDKHVDSNGEEDSDSGKEEHQKASVKQDKTQKRMTEDEKDKVKRSKGKSKSRRGSDQAEETDHKSCEGDGTDKQTDHDKTGPSFFRNPSIRSTLLMEFLKEKVKSELETEAPKLCGSKGIGGLVENPQFLVYLGSFKVLTPIAIQEVEIETTWAAKTKKLVGHLAACSSKQIFAFVWILIEMNYGHHLKAITPEVTSLMREYTKDMVEKMS